VSLAPLIIGNPRAGGGRAGKTFPAMRAVIERTLGPVDVQYTDRPAHAIDLARAAAEAGRERIVAVGGDGTLHEVANGVLAAGKTAARVGFVGQGTGGDFRRSLGIAHRLDRYVEAIGRGVERWVDAGKLTYTDEKGATRERYFVNIVSAGVGGLVDRYVADTSRSLGMTAAYAMASLRAIAACERGRVRCTYTSEGERAERTIDAYLVAVCNGRYFGSGMHMAPSAKLDDGRFDVVAIGGASKLAFTMTSRKVYSGGHLKDPGVTTFACDTIAMDLVGPSPSKRFLLDVDGEPLGGLPAKIEILPRALGLLA
jgi:YegS/Rv2252/BmrU family lipid kinase